jgi:hypothetical protein
MSASLFKSKPQGLLHSLKLEGGELKGIWQLGGALAAFDSSVGSQGIVNISYMIQGHLLGEDSVPTLDLKPP